MPRTLPPLLLVLLVYSGGTNGLCTLENGTTAHCHDLEDVKYIDTYNLESLIARIEKPVLHLGFFVNLTSLRHLDLSRGSIERIEPGSFGKLNNLRSLNLSENRISDLELNSLDGLSHLHSLNLSKNDLKHLPFALTRLKALRYLDVHGNPLRCDCATSRTKDLILKRGVKITRKVFCEEPKRTKGSSLFKLDTLKTCDLEEQDLEMQNDQAYNDPEEEYGSGDRIEKKENSQEYVEVPDHNTEDLKELEIETPFPETSETSTIVSNLEPTLFEGSISSTSTTESSGKSTEKDEEIFFDSEEKKEQSTIAATEKKKIYKDALLYPVEGSGDRDEGSGEGSGAGVIFGGWQKIGEVERSDEEEEKESSSNNGWFDMFLNVLWSTTESSKTTDDPDLEEEQFIDASSAKGIEEEVLVPVKVNSNQAVNPDQETTVKSSSVAPTVAVELVDDELHDMTKLQKVKIDDSTNEDLAEVSPTKQSKKGMGSYVVLAALLAILATLIGFAAYKGDFCRKKRKRGDVETGTEMKDMQKALLETGNATQPKIASNGNVENSPLVVDAINREETKPSDDPEVPEDGPKSSNGISDRAEILKPSRLSSNDLKIKDKEERNSFRDDSSSGRIGSANRNRPAEFDGPPVSPNAQRVKITVQENPDSVPRTPILITRTMAGENLVKMP